MMRSIIKRLVSLSFAFALLALAGTVKSDEMGTPKMTIALEKSHVREYLPIAFDIKISNESSVEVEVFPYDINRLPSVIPSIKFEGFSTLPPANPQITDLGVPVVKIRPFESTTLHGYLQDYFNHFPPGAYTVSYHIHWEYAPDVTHATRTNKPIDVSGQLQFNVSNADASTVEQYISERTAILQQSTNLEQTRRAADDLVRIDNPAVVPALKKLKDKGYELEVLHATDRLPEAQATEVLSAVTASSTNPAIVKAAMERIERRGSKLPEDIVRELLSSKSKWLQIEAIDYIGRTNNGRFRNEVATLSQSPDPDVSKAARRAGAKLDGGPPK